MQHKHTSKVLGTIYLGKSGILEAIKRLQEAVCTPELPPNWEGMNCDRGVWFTSNANKGSVEVRGFPFWEISSLGAVGRGPGPGLQQNKKKQKHK